METIQADTNIGQIHVPNDVVGVGERGDEPPPRQSLEGNAHALVRREFPDLAKLVHADLVAIDRRGVRVGTHQDRVRAELLSVGQRSFAPSEPVLKLLVLDAQKALDRLVEVTRKAQFLHQRRDVVQGHQAFFNMRYEEFDPVEAGFGGSAKFDVDGTGKANGCDAEMHELLTNSPW